MTSSVTDAATVTVETVDKLIREIPDLTPPPVSELVTDRDCGVNGGPLLEKRDCIGAEYTNSLKTVTVQADTQLGWIEVRGPTACVTRELVTRDQAEAREADLLRQLAALEAKLADKTGENERNRQGFEFHASLAEKRYFEIKELKAKLAAQPDRSAVLEEAAKAAEGSSKSFDHQAALADHRDCESGFHGGRVAAARSIRALKEQP